MSTAVCEADHDEVVPRKLGTDFRAGVLSFSDGVGVKNKLDPSVY
jgi:hypothetical protein